MKRSIPLLALLASLLALLLPVASVVRASSYRCTTAQVNTRTCPSMTCPKLYTYDPGTLLLVTGQVTEESVGGDSIWLTTTDPLSEESEYIRQSFTAACEVASWQTSPIIPTVSETAKSIYRRGLAAGNNAHGFSKVGDCLSADYFFLGDFDDPARYNLGPYGYLAPVLEQFKGSFSQRSAAAKNGLNVASAFSPLWAPASCQRNETPLACEYRLHKPSIVIISLGSWGVRQPASEFKAYLRQIVQFWIDHGVVPIIGTKADNLEQDGSINASIAQVAREFDVPLWNFWLAEQPIPNHGLTSDNLHLQFARNDFADETTRRTGWTVRNLTALQALNAVWKSLNTESN